MKNKKIKIIIIILFVILTIFGIITAIYFLSTDFYLKIKYRNSVKVENVVLNKNDNSSLEISNRINNYIRTKSLFGTYVISKSSKQNSLYKTYTNGIASISFIINNDGTLNIKFNNITDANKNSYLDKIPEQSIDIRIDNENIKYITKDEYYLYILTEKGNLYISKFDYISNTVEFEKNLDNLKSKKFINKLTENNIKEMFFYYENSENNNFARLYVLLNDNNKINPLTNKSFEESETFAKFYRFGNASIVVNRNGTIQFCRDYQDATNCRGMNLGQIITDTNGNPIKVSLMFDIPDSKLFIIDENGNIYAEEYDNQDHHFIKILNKYNNKNVSSLTYVSLPSERYMLKELIINYSNGTRDSFEKISRGRIYTK